MGRYCLDSLWPASSPSISFAGNWLSSPSLSLWLVGYWSLIGGASPGDSLTLASPSVPLPKTIALLGWLLGSLWDLSVISLDYGYRPSWGAHCLFSLFLATRLQLSLLPLLLPVKLPLNLPSSRQAASSVISLPRPVALPFSGLYQTIAYLNLALSHFLIFQTIASPQSHIIYLQPL